MYKLPIPKVSMNYSHPSDELLTGEYVKSTHYHAIHALSMSVYVSTVQMNRPKQTQECKINTAKKCPKLTWKPRIEKTLPTVTGKDDMWSNDKMNGDRFLIRRKCEVVGDTARHSAFGVPLPLCSTVDTQSDHCGTVSDSGADLMRSLSFQETNNRVENRLPNTWATQKQKLNHGYKYRCWMV